MCQIEEIKHAGCKCLVALRVLSYCPEWRESTNWSPKVPEEICSEAKIIKKTYGAGARYCGECYEGMREETFQTYWTKREQAKQEVENEGWTEEKFNSRRRSLIREHGEESEWVRKMNHRCDSDTCRTCAWLRHIWSLPDVRSYE